MKYAKEVIIYRNCRVVFDHLTNPEKLKNWIEGLVSSTPVSELAPDQPYMQVIRQGRKDQILQGTVVAIEPSRRFAFTLSSPSSKSVADFKLHSCEKETATRIIFTEEITPIGFWAELQTKFLFQSNLKKKASELIKLKAFLDAGGDKS